MIRGLTGKVSDVGVAVEASSKLAPLTTAPASNDIDLKRMACWAMNYLIRTPRPELNYEPVFQCYPLRCPPVPAGHDVVVPCDTDARLNWEWYYMREISGSQAGWDVEAAFHRRMIEYVQADGTVLAPPGAYNEGDVHKVYSKADYHYHVWGATKILFALAEDFRRTHNAESKGTARRIMVRLKKLAVYPAPDRCYFPAGMGAMKADGTVVPNGWNKMPAPVIIALVNYYRATGDAEALAFAKAYAEGIMAGSQPDGVRFAADGNFTGGHSHATMHALWGMADLALVTGDERYTDFAKRAWDWMLSLGTGTGWFPATTPFHPTDETCLTSDMMSNAACIARGGHPEYFDFVERYLRNRISLLQFIMTPEFEAEYRKVNAAAGEEKIRAGLAELHKFEGGIQSYTGLDDYENSRLKGTYAGLAGCCTPEGMRAIYTAWNNTIDRLNASRLGPAGVYVNLSFGRTSPWGRVVPFLPDAGRLTVQAAVADTFFLRPPHWVPCDRVRAFVGQREVPPAWSGAYVRFDRRQPGDEMTITYPLIRFTHTPTGPWKEKMTPVVDLAFDWIGNTIVASRPAPEGTRLFTGKPRRLPNPPETSGKATP
ncbi:MAG: glycoside hydrolase family 127 protein [Phycisphaerae bacterium]|nr:glycoside hydrolase family 127 protein [Phycisphaerae bacterium]